MDKERKMSTRLSIKLIIGLVVIGLVGIPAFSSTLDDELQKLKDAGIPTTFEELNLPEILPVLPLDLFTGKDYIYKKKGKEFIVYSVGENLRDDGGLRRKA